MANKQKKGGADPLTTTVNTLTSTVKTLQSELSTVKAKVTSLEGTIQELRDEQAAQAQILKDEQRTLSDRLQQQGEEQSRRMDALFQQRPPASSVSGEQQQQPARNAGGQQQQQGALVSEASDPTSLIPGGTISYATFNLLTRTFSMRLYEGSEKPRESVSKVTASDQRVTGLILSKEIWESAEAISQALEVLREFGRFCVSQRYKDDESVILFQKLWAKGARAKEPFERALKEARSVKTILEHLSMWLVTDVAYNRHIAMRDSLVQLETESLASFITRVQPWIEENDQQMPVSRWLHDTLLTKIHSSWKTRSQVAYNALLEFLMVSEDFHQLSDEKREKLSFENLHIWMVARPRREYCFAGASAETKKGQGGKEADTPKKGVAPKATPGHRKKGKGTKDQDKGKSRDLRCFACQGNHYLNDCTDTAALRKYAKQQLSEKQAPLKESATPPAKGGKDSAKVAEWKKQAQQLSVKIAKAEGKEVDKEEGAFKFQVNRGVTIMMPNCLDQRVENIFVDKDGQVAEAGPHEGGYDTLDSKVFMVRQTSTVHGAEEVHTAETTVGKTCYLVGTLDGKYVVVHADTGADALILTRTQATSVGLECIPSPPHKVEGLGGGTATVIAKSRVTTVVFGKRPLRVEWSIIEDTPGYTSPVVPFHVLASLSFHIVSLNHLRVGDMDFYRSVDNIYTPATTIIGGDLEDHLEADQGLEPLLDTLDSNTVKVTVRSGEMKAHANEQLAREIPDLPFEGAEFDPGWEHSRKCEWLYEAFIGLRVELKGRFLRLLEGRDMETLTPEVLEKLARTISLLRSMFTMCAQRPLPVIKDANGKEVICDFEMVDGVNPDTYRKIVNARRHSPDRLKVLAESCEAYRELGCTRPLAAGEPAPVVLESVFAANKTGTYRHCIDATAINNDIKKEAMLYSGAMAEHFWGARPSDFRWMIGSDVAKAFNLVKLSPLASRLLTFRTPQGLERWLRMPFGPSNAPAVWARAVADLSAGLPNTRRQVDDILTFGPTLGSTLDTFNSLLSRYLERNVPMNPNKLEFLWDETTFAGRIIDSNGVMRPKVSHVQRILGLENPKDDPKAARILLGLANWLNNYIPSLSRYVAPFSAFTRAKNAEEYDGLRLEKEFALLMQQVRKYVRLRVFDSGKSVWVMTDACDYAIAAALLQPLDEADLSKGFVLCELHSRTLNKTQKGWATIEKECFSIIFHLGHWKDLIYGVVIHVWSDHKPLRWLFREMLNGGGPARVHRWLILLMGWTILVEYIPGSRNQLADVLSRFVLEEDPKEGTIARLAVKVLAAKPDVSTSFMEAIDNDAFARVALEELGAPGVATPQFSVGTLSEDERAEAMRRFKEFGDSLKVVGKRGLVFQGAEDHFARRYIPKGVRKEIFRDYHGSLHAGHLSWKETLRRLELFCWWPDMAADAERWGRACHMCQIGKPNGTTLNGMFGIDPLRKVAQPFQMVTVDWKPMPKLEASEWTGFFVARCEATHFCVLGGATTNSSENAARFLLDRIVLVFGPPMVLKSGRDGEWISQLIVALVELLGINQHTTFPYSPQGIGGNERSHLELDNLVRTSVAREDWDKCLMTFSWILNTRSVSTLGGLSPYEALFGYSPLNPVDAALTALLSRELGTDAIAKRTLEEHVRLLQSNTRIREAHRALQSWQAKERFEAQCGKGIDYRVKVGDLIAIKSTPSKEKIAGAKHSPKWLAPFKVIRLSKDRHNLTLQWLYDDKIVVERGAHDCKLYYLDNDDPDVKGHDAEAVSFEVEEILDRRGSIDDQEYYVKWLGFPSEFNSWVERADLNGAKQMRDAFDAGHPLEEELLIAEEPNVQPSLELVQIARDQIESFIEVKDTRHGVVLVFMKRGLSKRQRVPTQVLLSRLPKEIQEDPEVRLLIEKNKTELQRLVKRKTK